MVTEYNKEFSTSRVDDIERAISKLDAELEKLVDALIDAPKALHPKLYARMEQLEHQKAEFEADAAKMRIAMGLRLTESEVISWLNTFRAGDPADPSFRRRLIDAFINCVYVYDDRIIVFYNIRSSSPSPLSSNPSLLHSLQTKKDSSSDNSDLESLGRGRRIRTLNKGFGDPRVTITPFPCATGVLYRRS